MREATDQAASVVPGPFRLSADSASIARAAEILRGGGLVAFPTETVYGLGARADDDAAVRRIYEAKGRPATNPSIVHVASIDAASRLAHLDPVALALAAAFWPGPLTLVARVRTGAVSPVATAGGDTVAIRVPAHPVARSLLAAVGLPIAAPSANRSTHVSPTTADHVLRSLGDRIDAIVDGGPADHGIESTIVRAAAGRPIVVLRLGALPLAAIAAFVSPEVVLDASSRVDAKELMAPAPGGQVRHYAPIGRLVVVDRADLAQAVSAAEEAGERVGVVASSGGPALVRDAIDLPGDAVGFASGLYAALHDLEARGCASIVVERVPDGDDWSAVRDRLRRASVPDLP